MLAAAVRMLPSGRRELGEAILAEARQVPSGRRRRRWLAGGVWFVTKELVMRERRYDLGVLAAVAALVAVDRIGTSDDSSQVSLLVLLVGAAALGFALPRRAWLTGLIIGSALAVAGMAEAALGLAAPHVPRPGGVAGAATLFVLIVPSMAGAYLGAGAQWLRRRTD